MEENKCKTVMTNEEKYKKIEGNGRSLSKKIKSIVGMGEDLDANTMQKIAVKLSYFSKFLDKLAMGILKYLYLHSPSDAKIFEESFLQLKSDMSKDVSNLKDSEYRKILARNMNTFKTCAEVLEKDDFWKIVKMDKSKASDSEAFTEFKKLSNLSSLKAKQENNKPKE